MFLGVADVIGCCRCYRMLAMLGMLFDAVWVLGIFLDVGDFFWMLGMFLDVGDVFGCWGCFWVLGMFLDVGDVFWGPLGVGDVFRCCRCFSSLSYILRRAV